MLFNNYLKKKALKKLYKSLVITHDLCFDIGANLGYKSIILLELKNKVIGFEPQTSCKKPLKKIATKNSHFLYEKIALGAENFETELNLGNHIEIATLSNKFIQHFKNEKIYWHAKEKVTVKTLDSQIKKNGLPKYCKIDAEGYEYEILKNLTYKIPIIEFEFTGGFIKETLLCIEKISSLGDYTFNYILNENPKLEIKQWVSKKEILTIIKALKSKNLHGNIFARIQN